MLSEENLLAVRFMLKRSLEKTRLERWSLNKPSAFRIKRIFLVGVISAPYLRCGDH